jgi:flagellar basal-body rod protein FlgG
MGITTGGGEKVIRGLYTASSGMIAEMARNDVTANNLANVNTTGYKRDTAIAGSFPEVFLHRVNDQRLGDRTTSPVIGGLGTGAIIEEIVTVHEQGQLRESANPFDLAIAGEGFFAVQNEKGTFHTRNGSFTLDGQGYLVTLEGDMVLGQTGPIKIGASSDVVIDSAGKITVDGQTIATLRLETPDDITQLSKQGDSLFTGGQATAGISGQVKQKFTDGSNVNVINEMINMITISRAYEANQKILSSMDHTLGQAMGVGKVR